MGELSKNVGENGEDVANAFLQMIGWGAVQHGTAFRCLYPEKHEKANDARGTHGIDFVIAKRSPLMDAVGQNLVVSVKFSKDPYKKNPTPVFKQHFIDLAHTLECFKNSDLRKQLLQSVKGVSRTQDIGVLLWINNDPNSASDVISQVSRAILPDTLNYESIYLVDNQRVQFLFSSVKCAKTFGDEVAFFYPDTGKNVNPMAKETHGSFLPVEFINSSVLPFRVFDAKSNQRILLLSTLESFSETGLKRLMGLAQSISQGWSSKVILMFPDYNKLKHENVVQTAKMSFSNETFVGGTEVHSYSDDFRNLSM